MTSEHDRSLPCIALMGEFSAGKSTLANLLIGCDPIPVQIIATQLPPVMISYGDGNAFAVMEDGTQHPVDVQDLGNTPVSDALYIQIFATEEILKHCDILDMPGISDPNMASSVWERMIDRADGVLWCSHATQAWRQSEAATWESLPEDLRDRSLLLLTRVDKLPTLADRERVLTRVRKETQGLFADVLPISLLLATQEQTNYTAWAQSGAEEFADRLVALLAQLSETSEHSSPQTNTPAIPGLVAPMTRPTMTASPHHGQRIMPRRVKRIDRDGDRPALPG